MTTISAVAIASSRNTSDPDPSSRRLTSVLCRYPRWIHAEGRTHRLLSLGEDFDADWCSFEPRTPSPMEDPMLSRNASSSRAIPVRKMIDDVLADPAVPLFWGKNQRGMQGGEECSERVGLGSTWWPGEKGNWSREDAWLGAMHDAIRWARRYDEAGYHKQIVNRLIEPFSHITVVFSATEWSNFFKLRIHADAEPHIRLLAERIREAIDTAPVEFLQPGEWHLSFVGPDDRRSARAWAEANRPPRGAFPGRGGGAKHHSAGVPFHLQAQENLRKLAVARCASTSYKTVDGFDMTLERAVALHDKLVAADPIHASPCEHVAQADEWVRALDRSGWNRPEEHGNFVGWRQYRRQLPGGIA